MATPSPGNPTSFCQTERQRVLAWRVERLAKAGFPAASLHGLAGRRDVDLHVAESLIRRGCPAETAVRILI